MSCDKPDYDPLEDLVTILSGIDSLDHLDKLLVATREHKLRLHEEVKAERELADSPLGSADDELDQLIHKVERTQQLSKSTESTISDLTKDIAYLDTVKKNLTHSMAWFQNLNDLSESYCQCKHYLEQQSFKEMSAPYAVMTSLSDMFQGYKSVTEINRLLELIRALEDDTIHSIKQLYRKLFESKETLNVTEATFKEGACVLLESNPTDKFEVINWSLDKILGEIREIFQVDDEAGSLENISRRYLFFKRVLNNFQANFASYFPASWEMPLRLTSMFFIFTKHDIQILLDREMKKTPSLELFMEALQATVDFEKYIGIKFSNKLSNITHEKISTCFEPHLSLWLSHHDQVMNSKMLAYMSETKLPNSSDSHVVPSSAALFRTYRQILSQTLELTDGEGRSAVLSDLAGFFSKWLIEYSNKILQPLLLPENARMEEKDEVIQYTILMINTADYCSITAGQLEEKLQEYVDSGDTISKQFDKAKSRFGLLVSQGLQFLLTHILSPELHFAWREFSNSDWRHPLGEGYSRYIVTLEHILTPDDVQGDSLVHKLLSQFNRDVFVWNMLDRITELVTTEFLRCITKLLVPKEPFGNMKSRRQFTVAQVIGIGKQLLLDCQSLERILKKLPEGLPDGKATQNNRINRHIDTNIAQLSALCKVLAVPLDSPASYHDEYFGIINNKNHAVWALVFALKGMQWEISEWKTYWEEFKTRETSATESSIDLFIFYRDESTVRHFVAAMLKVVDPGWKAFASEELRLVSSRSSSRPSTPPPSNIGPARNKSINENLKNLVSNTRFFNRGG
ncbi:ACR044Cp [Eremothecium gossypii ATCC 10895]|uniref:ACR044Cp n=1 Tax=Eremothecium gossypii (strain ATCC 10895 / CBS 109.51 / FGSC 9923 / NRRL Y-1056) TaxID=284811 RepID=Q75C72_EREGS|nr:ACR044Cp [Eremothecium gossypii ATCC 10895]AAS51271.2 ACR044Cp [Eremothecium gossypii ATCC 10895]AEY95562.1 FACR044Cp [Eremothecium gossypii FDAG1]